jgi:hypothetical protein
MDTSVTIIGLVLTLVIAIPFFYSVRSSSVNKSKIKSIKDQFSQNGHFNFEITESLNKKVLALDEKNKGFLLMDFNSTPEIVSFVNLNEILASKLIVTTENKTNTTNKIELEFTYKENKKAASALFYKIENDQLGQVRLHEDHQLAKKWKDKIDNCIS